MGTKAEINTSLGGIDQIEDRTFGRKYLTVGHAINSGKELFFNFYNFLRDSVEGRRFVFRGLLSKEAQDAAVKYHIPVEAKIPMKLVTGDNNEESAIVYIAKNRHRSPTQGENQKERIKNRTNGRKPIERARDIKTDNEFIPIKNLTPDDSKDLFELWKRFGWKENEIVNFITRVMSGEKNLWFSGVRDIKTGRLVSACNAEAIEFSGIRYIETTEYSTLRYYEGKSLNTTAVSGLIAQVLSDVYYKKNDNLINVITAEFNTSSNSASVGASSGFIIPEVQGVSGILSYNVAVDDGQAPNEVFKNSDKTDRGIPYSMLRDFALGVLPIQNINDLYPEEVVQEIINLYQ